MLRISTAVAALLAAFCVPSLAQTFPRGQVVERVAARGDTTQRYALYLPSGYDAARTWPVLFLMDPRGRALVPLERARGAAEALGWVVLSSYNTASDAAASPNEAALEAMLDDAQARLSVDERRVYLGGFSGTAREAWTFAVRMGGSAAGVIGFGAGVPNERVLLRLGAGGTPPFAFFGGAGTTDFNHTEVRELDGRLDAAGVPHRVVFYPGAHAWPDSAVFREAMEWMELRATRAGTSARGAAWADSLRARRTAEAAARETAAPAEAPTLWRRVAEDFGGSDEARRAEVRVRALERLPAVRRAREDEARIAARDSVHVRRFLAFTREVGAAPRPPEHRRMMADLEIAVLRREAAGADTLRAQSARRLLENVFVYASFYGPGAFTARGHTDRALALLRLAGEIHADDPQVCLATAQAHTRAGRPADALRALECVVASGRVRGDALRADPLLAPLHDEPAWRALLERVDAPRG